MNSTQLYQRFLSHDTLIQMLLIFKYCIEVLVVCHDRKNSCKVLNLNLLLNLQNWTSHRKTNTIPCNGEDRACNTTRANTGESGATAFCILKIIRNTCTLYFQLFY